LLDGFALRELGFADWLARERMRMAERAGAVLLQLADAETAAMNQVGAIAVLMRAINLDPLLEEAHRRLIRLYIDQGRYNSALQQYRVCEAVRQYRLLNVLYGNLYDPYRMF
jgi:DNA-binding SARP family transcriptional activator